VPVVDELLVSIGRVIGKPRGWERVVRAVAPPRRFRGAELRPRTVPEGYTFPIDRGTLIGWNVHFFGSYEPEVREQIKRWLGPGDVAIDVGANVGWHTLLMATRVGPRGRVYAFEPNETTRVRLLDAVRANRLAQVIVDARAAAEHSGAGGFQAPPAGEVWDGTGRLLGPAVQGGSAGGHDGPPRGSHEVECVTLDRFAAASGIDRIHLVKIDVEGWELSVLRGARRLLDEARPVVVFEYDPAYVSRCGGTGADLTACLAGSGYSLFALERGRPPSAVARLGECDGNFLAVPTERAGP
jgi:FkbM family methyltransferase